MLDSLLKIPGCSLREEREPRRAVLSATRWPALFCLAATLACSGCLFQKKPRAFVPPNLPAPPSVVPKPVPMVDAAPELQRASLTPDVITAPLPSAAPADVQIPPPPRPAPPPRRPPPTPASVRPVPVEVTPTPAPPRIAQLLSPQETSKLTRTYDDSMGRVDRALMELSKKTLASADRDLVELIRSFQTQAKQSHDQDLVTATGLAQRADVLAKDLLGRLP